MQNNIIKLRSDIADDQRLHRAVWGYAARRVSHSPGAFIVGRRMRPKVGDLVLAKVTRLGQHRRIELPNGRRARMFVGDEIVVVYGNRYAPDQFEAIVPEDLSPCHLVAAGGIAGQMMHKHGSMKMPTSIEPIGLVMRTNGRAVNISQFAVPPMDMPDPTPPIIAVLGGSMNSGKTTTAASLIHGLTRSGMKVVAGKVTGTGSGCDPWHLQDAGAVLVMDYLDIGHPTTYLLPPEKVEKILKGLVTHLANANPDCIILEVADGLFQAETAALIQSHVFRSLVKGVLYASADALGAVHGVEMLQRWGIPVCGISGVISRSPLGMRETLDAVHVPVYTRKVLADGGVMDHVATWFEQGQTTAMDRERA